MHSREMIDDPTLLPVTRVRKSFAASGLPIIHYGDRSICDIPALWKPLLISLAARLSGSKEADALIEGEGGITHDALAGKPHFECGAFDHGAALQRRNFALVSFEKLSERSAFKDFRVRGRTEPVDLCFEVARSLFSFELRVERFAPGLQAATAHLRLPTSSEFSDCRHGDLQHSLSIMRRMPRRGGQGLSRRSNHTH